MSIKGQIAKVIWPVVEPLARAMFATSMSYSAAGEDRIVKAWLETFYHVDVTRMRYLDIGANHPVNINNTYLFYLMGASGVLVEPDPDLCGTLNQTRPRDTVLNAGCAFDERRRATLTRLTARVFNTFSDQHANFVIKSSDNWLAEQQQKIVDQIDIALVPANEILAKHFPDGVDFISIDAEGVDLQILQSIDLKRFRPKLICVEAWADFDSILAPTGYQMVANTPDNMIFRLIG